MKRGTLIKLSDIVFTVSIAAAGILLWALLLPSGGGNTAVFRQNGEVIAELPLTEDAEYEVTGAYTNVFGIRDGAVRVTHTDCPNRQCQKAGAISAAGANITCAPNRVSVTITGKGAEVDAVTG